MTVSKEDALKEAYKRGLLSAEKKAAYEEAVRRGLIDGDTDPTIGKTLMQVPTEFNKTLTAPALRALSGPNSAYGLARKAGSALYGKDIPDPVGSAASYYESAPEPQNAPERVAARVGEEAVWALPFGAGSFGFAHKGAQLFRGGANKAIRGIGSMLEGVYNAPLKAAAGEVAATVGAGIGGGLAEEAFPGNKAANIAGTVAGGVAPFAVGYTPTSIVLRMGRWLGRRMSPNIQARMAEEEVAGMLNIGPEDAKNLRTADSLQKEMPGTEFSLAEATGKTSLVRTQQAFEAQKSGSALDELVARRIRNEDAIDGYRAAVSPGMEESPDYIIDRTAMRVRELTAGVDQQAAKVTAKREGIVETKLPKLQDRAAQGQQLRELRDQLYEDAQKALAAYKTELGLDDVPGQVSFKDVSDDLHSSLDKSFWDDIADYPTLLGKLSKYEGDTISLNDLVKMRQQVSSEYTKTVQNRAAPNPTKTRNLAILEAELDKIISREFGAVDPSLAKAWEQFRSKYYTDVVERFRKGAAAKITAKGSYGFYQTADEDVAKAFWTGGESSMRQFNRVFGDDPAAQTAIASAALDDLRVASVVDGVIDPKKFASWTKRNERLLDEFPHIKSLVDDIKQADSALQVRQSQLHERKTRIEKGALVNRIYRATNGEAAPEQIISDAIKDPRKMMFLANRLRNEREAYAGLQRSVWDEVTGGTADDVLRHIEGNRKSLEIIFSNEHLNNITKIQKARAMAETVPVASGKPLTPDPIDTLAQKTGIGLPQAASRFYAFKSGRLNKAYLVTEQLGRIGRQYFSRHATNLIEEALYDPAVARDLSDFLYLADVRPHTVNRLNGYIFHLGEQTLREDEEQNAN